MPKVIGLTGAIIDTSKLSRKKIFEELSAEYKKSAYIGTSILNSQKQTPLIVAAKYNPIAVEWILDEKQHPGRTLKDAAINHIDEKSRSALFYAVSYEDRLFNEEKIEPALQQKRRVIDLLLKKGANPFNGSSCIKQAIHKDNLYFLKKFFQSSFFNVKNESHQFDACTLLYQSIINGKTEYTDLLGEQKLLIRTVHWSESYHSKLSWDKLRPYVRIRQGDIKGATILIENGRMDWSFDVAVSEILTSLDKEVINHVVAAQFLSLIANSRKISNCTFDKYILQILRMKKLTHAIRDELITSLSHHPYLRCNMTQYLLSLANKESRDKTEQYHNLKHFFHKSFLFQESAIRFVFATNNFELISLFVSSNDYDFGAELSKAINLGQIDIVKLLIANDASIPKKIKYDKFANPENIERVKEYLAAYEAILAIPDSNKPQALIFAKKILRQMQPEDASDVLKECPSTITDEQFKMLEENLPEPVLLSDLKLAFFGSQKPLEQEVKPCLKLC